MARTVWIATAVVIGAALITAFTLTQGPKRDPALTDKTRQYKVVRKDLVVEIVDTGRIEPRQQVEVKSKVSGQVMQVMVDEGDTVEARQILLLLEPTDYKREVARAKADVAQAKNALTYAELELKRKRKALAHRGVAEIEVALAENDVKAKALELQSSKIELSAALDQLRYTKLKAPIAGTILELGIKKGEVVTPGVQQTFEGRPLLKIGDLSQLVVRSELNQIDIAGIELEQEVEIKFDALPGRTFEGRVSKIAPAAVKTKGQDVEMFPVEASLTNADSAIKPGMTADVRFRLNHHQDVLPVPIEAVLKAKDGKRYVIKIVASAEGPKKEKVEAKLGPRNDREQVIATGLQEGDVILIDPPSSALNEVEL